MKKYLNLLFFTVMAVYSQQTFAQSADCSAAVQICNGIYPQPSATAGIGTDELDFTNDGCLAGENGSNWYYVQVTTAGTISFSAQGETSTGASADIDGAVWGPFASVAAGCTAINGGNDPIRCSFAAAPYGITLQGTTNGTSEGTYGNGVVNAITGTAVGQYYLIFLDNYNAGNPSAAVSVTLDFLGGNTAVYACPAPPTPCAPTCAAATSSVCPKQDDGNIDALDGDVLPTNAFGTCYSYDVNPFKAGDSFTQCYQLNSGASGTLGAVQQVSIYGTDASLPDGPDCQGTVLASRTFSLVQSCGGANIPATLALGAFSSTFNPQWDNLTPNTNYVLCISTTIPVTPGITCNYRESCLDFYHPDRAGCSLVASATTPVKEYCYGTTPGTIAADMGFSVTSFYAGPNATSSAGVGFAEICGDYNAALNTTAGDPTTNPSYTGFIVQSTYAYNPGTATGTDGEGSSCDYITLVPLTYISVNASGNPIIDGNASNICTSTPIRIDFRPRITPTSLTYSCTTGVTISPDGGSQDDGKAPVTEADGTATVLGSYTVAVPGATGTPFTVAEGGNTGAITGLSNGTVSVVITDSDACTSTVNMVVNCACPTSTQPAATTQSICSGGSANTGAANAAITAGITDAGSTQLGGITWFTDAALTTVYSGGAIAHSGVDNCVKETVTLYAGIQCDKDGNAVADDLDADATTDPDYIAAGTLPVDVYPTPVVGQNFTVPTAPCVTAISTACTSLTIGYGTSAAGPFVSTPPTINPGDPNITVFYEVYVTGAPALCTKATGSYTVTCPVCPSSTIPTPVQPVCSGTTPTLPDATIQAAITDPNTKQLGGITWFTDAAMTTVYVPAATSNTTCADAPFSLYAGIQCDKDGDLVADDLDASPATDPDYIAAGTFTVTVYPAVQAPTIASSGCAVTVTGACASDIVTLSGAPATGTITNNGTNAATYTAAPGDAAGTISYSVATGVALSSCAPNASTTATPACAAICTSPTPTAAKSGNLGCAPSTVTLSVTGLASGPAYTYLWTGGQTTATKAVTAPGTYTVTVSDPAGGVGCAATSSVVVARRCIQITDPCVCLAPASPQDFSEVVTVTTGVSGETWTVTALTCSGGASAFNGSGIAVGSVLTPNPIPNTDGIYSITFNHIEGCGYELTVTESVTGDVMTISNSCTAAANCGCQASPNMTWGN